MIVSIIILGIVALMLIVMGIVVLAGKGDNLIAGYNTAPREEKEKVDIKKLRLLIGVVMLVLAPLMLLLVGEPSMESVFAFAALTIILCAVVVALANTWAMKK